MMKSNAERSAFLFGLSLFVAACSGADTESPEFEPATVDSASGADTRTDDVSEQQASSSDVLAQQADAATPVVQAATCPNGKGTLRSGRQTITVNGKSRAYIVQVPSSYRGDKPVPLMVDLHPLLMNASFQQGNSGYAAISNREGFIVVWPEGTREGVSGTGWNLGKCCTKSDDETFIRELVKKLKGEACIDEKRVYAAGFSMGGGMSHYLACNAADVFAATSPAAFDLLVENEMPCKPSRPISLVIFRGTSDLIVPFRGGASSPPNGSPGPIHFEGAEGTFKRWAEINGCSGQPTSGTAGCRTYGQCKDGVEVTLCVKQGGGHQNGDTNFAWSRLSKYSIP